MFAPCHQSGPLVPQLTFPSLDGLHVYPSHVGHFSNCWDLTSSNGRQKGFILAHSLWDIDHLSGKGTMTEREVTLPWESGNRQLTDRNQDESYKTWKACASPSATHLLLQGSPHLMVLRPSQNRWGRDPIHKPVREILHSNHNDSKHNLNGHTIWMESSPSRNSVFIHPWLLQDDFKGQASGMPRRNNSMLLSLAFRARMKGKT